MAAPSRPFGKLVLAVLLLACAGAAFWFKASEEERAALLTPVKEQVQNLLSSFGVSFSDTSTEEEGEQAKSAKTDNTGSKGEFSAPIATDSRSEVAAGDSVQGKITEDSASAFEDELLARVDKALAESGASAVDGDSVSGTLSDTPPDGEEQKDDSVVTSAFVQDLAQWLVASYRPPRKEGGTGYTTATLERVNSRYANSPHLRSVEQDAMRGRASILRYVYTPGMMEALYLLYAPRFLAELENAARQPSHASPLETWQIADMYTVYGECLQKLASSLFAASNVDLQALVNVVLEADRKEREASEAFAMAYTAHAVALDAKRQEEVDAQNSRMMEQSRLAGIYAGMKEEARHRLVSELRSRSTSATLSSSDLLFLGEWIARHNGSTEATRTAASVCERMATQCRERSQTLMAPAASVSADESAATENAEEGTLNPPENSREAPSDVGLAPAPSQAMEETQAPDDVSALSHPTSPTTPTTPDASAETDLLSTPAKEAEARAQ